MFTNNINDKLELNLQWRAANASYQPSAPRAYTAISTSFGHLSTQVFLRLLMRIYDSLSRVQESK